MLSVLVQSQSFTPYKVTKLPVAVKNHRNPHYVDVHLISPPHNKDQQSSSSTHYQPLDTVTTDYTSMYTTPCNVPSARIGDQDYAIVNPDLREEDTCYFTVI